MPVPDIVALGDFMTRAILFLSALPDGAGRLKLEQEAREIREALKMGRDRDAFRFEVRGGVRWQDVSRAIEELQPEIVHFSGHGTGTPGLVLEEENASAQLISADALQRTFRLFPGVKCVVLNACYSQVQAEAIYGHVSCVIGMGAAIGDRAARDFAVGFYDGMGAGWGYQKAFDLGLARMANDREVLTPVLLLRDVAEGEASEVGKPGAIELENPGGRMAIESAFICDAIASGEDGVSGDGQAGGIGSD